MKNKLSFTIIFINVTILSMFSQEKPNILFVFSDDQTFESLGAINNDEIKTPNLDKLIAQGTLFTHAFNQGGWNGAICLASRAMMNKGQFLWNAKSTPYDLSSISKDAPSEENVGVTPWSLLMKQAGYDTYMTGKWHVSAKALAIFDTAKQVRPGMPNQTDSRYDRKLIEEGEDTWSPYDTSKNGYWKGGKHWSEIVGDNAISFLQKAKGSENPFFMYLAFNAPHDPRQSPKRFVDMYPLENIAIPKSFIPEYPYAEGVGAGKKLRDERLAPFPRTPHAVKVNRQEYYAIITHMDEQIGRILDALEKSGMADNTYIIFTSDHGLAVGDHGFIGKQNLYDRSIRVPLIVKGPEIPKATIIDEMVYLQDVMATSLDIASIKKPSHVEFNSLMPLIKKNKKSKYQEIYGAYINRQRMIRTHDFKLLIYPTINKIRLYDIKNDPDELVDLADDPNYKKTIKKLLKKFYKLQKQTGDSLDVSNILDEQNAN